MSERERTGPAVSGEKEEQDLRILVAEDNRHHQILILRLLSQLGLAADLVEDGVSALGAIRRKRYHLLLLDLNMPLMGGLEVSRAIVKEYPRTQRPFMVAVTAYTHPKAREECLEAGIDEYLPKPISVEDLKSVLGAFGIVARRERPAPTPPAENAEIPASMRERLSLLVTETDKEFVIELIDAYLDTGRPELSEIERALRAEDWDGLRIAAHTLKGSSRNLGADDLAGLLQEIENVATERRQTQTIDPIAIRVLFERAAAQLRRYQESL